MSKENLDKSGEQLWAEIDRQLDSMNKYQQQGFLNGAFLILNSYFTLANPCILDPFEVQTFLSSARSGIYNATRERGFDNSLMKPEMTRGMEGLSASYQFAAMVHRMFIGPLDEEQELEMTTAVSVADDLKRKAEESQDAGE